MAMLEPGDPERRVMSATRSGCLSALVGGIAPIVPEGKEEP